MQRRQFLKRAGISSLSAAAMGVIATNIHQSTQTAVDTSRDELESLKKAYAKLDSRTKILFRAVLVLAGVDLFLIF